MIASLALVFAVLVYTWLVYPILVLALARRRPAMTVFPDVNPVENPVYIFVAAYNEEQVIAERLCNLEAACAGFAGVRILVGDDCSDDRTAAITEAWAQTHPQVSLLRAERRGGKTAMLKRLFATLPVEKDAAIVFTDANTRFAPDALGKLLAPLADPKVGGVCGRLVFTGARQEPVMENYYWRAETLLKEAESRIDSCLGANGAIYAIRNRLFWTVIPDSTIVDDLVIGLKIREQGYRMIYAHDAVAYETAPREPDEWRRRVRIGAGDYQALALCRRCLHPRCGVFAWAFWSHKVLRWFTPHLLAALFAMSLFCLIRLPAGDWRAHLLGWGWGGAIAASLVGFLSQTPANALGRACRLWAHFIAMQAALVIGFCKFCKGGLKGTWERTGR